ncbi:MAG TPA: class I SAM-dependent methyltransferase [Acidimicrobiales bacterium]|nr:class I SAM-dependent methyltransferase [Acidimicrobiales bacterium]
MTNAGMAEYWNHQGGPQWIREQDRYDAMLKPMGRRLLDTAAITEGERVLDVGCGGGATTLEAAERVGPDGRAVGLDLSEPMLATARSRAGGATATFVLGDAQTERIEGPFDVVISRFGVMFFDDPVAAFTNLAGALRPGGRMCFVCWQEMLNNEWIRVPIMAIAGHVGIPEPPAPGEPGPFSLADPDRIQHILDQAGLSDVTVEEAAEPMALGRDPADVIDFMITDGMARRLVEGKDTGLIARGAQSAREALEPYASADGVRLGSAYWVVTARKA